MKRPRTIVKTFKQRYWVLVASKKKRQTVRPARWIREGTPEPAWAPRRGDLISCRRWKAKPYRSKQEALLAPQPIKRIREVVIWSEGVLIEGRILRPERRETFARKDGFDSWRDMRKTFQTMHGAGTFYGIVIEW